MAKQEIKRNSTTKQTEFEAKDIPDSTIDFGSSMIAFTLENNQLLVSLMGGSKTRKSM